MSKQIALVLTLFVAGAALGQVVYAPVRSIKDQGITLKAWGSGSIAETDEVAFEGVNSIRVSTRNYFQGGVFYLGTSVNLGAAFADKNNMLRFAIRVADLSMTFGGGPGKGGLPGPGGAGGPGKGGGSRAGGDSGGGLAPPGGGNQGLGGPGKGGLGGSGNQKEEPLRNLRVIISTSDGRKSEVYLPISTSAAADRNWRLVAIPLQAISGFAETNKTVSGIMFSGDATSTFYIGEVKVVNDSTPITGDTNYHELNLALGDEIDLIGYGFGGSSVLKYSWDFDDTDGIQVDAEGQLVKRKFRKPGTFKVTVTVGDVFGLKKPFQAQVKITVNP